MTSSKWTAADMPPQDGRTFVITGANSGIGLMAARALGGAGAHVVLAVRDEAKGRTAAIPGDSEVRHLDLADLASVRAFAAVHGLAALAGAGVFEVDDALVTETVERVVLGLRPR